MAKGHYTSRYGGSKSGYEKGVKDTLKAVGIGVLSIAAAVITIVNSQKK